MHKFGLTGQISKLYPFIIMYDWSGNDDDILSNAILQQT